MYRRIMASPDGFGDAGFSERVYALVHDITVRPNSGYISFNRGYGTGIRDELSDAEVLEYAHMVGKDDAKTGYKVRAFIKRNKQRNAALYDLPDDEVGNSFVVCPVLGVRTLNIKRPYVEGVLQLSWDQFTSRYPDAQLSCGGHGKRIAAQLHTVGEDGLTPHQASVLKATETRAAVGEDGLSINARKGRKTRKALMTADENGVSGYQKIAAVARPKQRETLAKQGKVSFKTEDSVWRTYRWFVDWLTKVHRDEVMSGLKTGRMGIDGAHQLDHIYPVFLGFRNKVSPWCIAHRANLEAVSWKENCDRRTKDNHDLNKLLSDTGYEIETSEIEYSRVLDIIQSGIRGSLNILNEYSRKYDTKVYRQ